MTASPPSPATSTHPLPVLLDAIRALAARAAAEILAVYARPVVATAKADESPLTEADLRSHRLICRALGELTPQWPVLSEESEGIDAAVRAGWTTYWLVDPLDGTREFVSRNGEFTVNIALVQDHRVVLGVVQIPVADLTYAGIPGVGAWRAQGLEPFAPIAVAHRIATPVRVLGSRSHRGDSLAGFLERVGPHELVGVGSSLKFCRLAEGLADVYPRLGPTCEWDTAAGQAVVEGAGGLVLTLDGQPLRYNTKAQLLNPDFVAVAADPERWLALLRGGARPVPS